MKTWKTLVGGAFALIATAALAADPAPSAPNYPSTTPPAMNAVPSTTPVPHQTMKPEMPGAGANVTIAKVLPSKKITGLNVRNPQGEKLGTVDDLVIDVGSGKVSYLALSVGGVMGIGDKLFAVPYEEITFNHGKDGMEVVLNISKEKLEAAPGFSKEQWPDFASPDWKEKVDSYYHNSSSSVPNQSSTSHIPPMVKD